MGATTAIAALSVHCFSKSHTHFSPFRTLPRITCSFSSSIEFTISFAPPKPKPKPKPEPDASNEPDGPLLIPRITRVDPAKDVIYVNGSRLPKRQPQKVYLALNKPKGYICSSGENESKSVISLFDDFLKSWGKKHPGVLTPRYIATVDGLVHKRHLIAISEGTTVEGVHCVPDVVELLPHQPEMQRARIRIVVHEGRKHEVRELVKSAGLEIHSLKRVRIGGFRLPPDLG
ncbi:Putative RNA pseudouridine synthase [Glycine soja]|nr:Putative RNA pseudouridine synthase [Glycine soja]